MDSSVFWSESGVGGEALQLISLFVTDMIGAVTPVLGGVVVAGATLWAIPRIWRAIRSAIG